jgi:hypothetical protein
MLAESRDLLAVSAAIFGPEKLERYNKEKLSICQKKKMKDE